ncbi:MAG: response regulator [Verrucomicrobia bacterium]|nr:response regulator [Verrucomicrobiota bacterium]
MPRPTTALIVDDEPSARTYVRLLLAEVGIATCWEAADGAKALVEFARHQPELVLLDINLRMTTGLQVLERLRRSSPGLPVIMLSSEDAAETVGEAMRLGAVDYLLKQSPKDEMLAKLRATLDALPPAPTADEKKS